MNFYEHHIGDYAEATSHLTMIEDGAYSRLIRKYYATEKPLPADIAKVQRLVNARSRAEKQAVRDVLEEFFFLEGDGWHNKRCDEDIAKYQAGEPEREARKANEDERQRRHREERARMFELLRGHDIHLPWNVGIEVLRAEIAKLDSAVTPAPAATNTTTDAPATAPATAPVTAPVTQPATAPATPATATQSPVPTTQYPEGNTGAAAARAPAGAREDGEKLSEEPLGTATAVGKALVKGGMQAATFNHSNPHVIALVSLGASELEVVDVTREALEKGNGLGWIVGAIKGRRNDVAEVLAKPPPPPRRGPPGGRILNRQEAIEAENRRVADEWLRQQEDADARK
jgi:uncharacterized protein YdaU (DUF1376 family)